MISQNTITPTRVYSAEDDRRALDSSKNISGPPVYYPPNHELFSSKEEASYKAQVRFMILFNHLLININDSSRGGMLGQKANTCMNLKANQKAAANREQLWFLYGNTYMNLKIISINNLVF